jgi:PPM family protein phosphatase
MELSFAAATDVGRKRTVNEDNFLIDKKLRLFLVADGMGGHAAGEIASSIAVHQIRDAIFGQRELIDRYRVDGAAVQPYEILQILEQAVVSACAAVHERATKEPDKRGMGTTSTLLLIAGHGAQLRGFIAHVGDTRVYLARQQQTHLLTEDHSLINELVKRGKLARDDKSSDEYKKYKNAVTRAVGVYASVAVDTFDFDILPGDQLMLCTDGMHAYLEAAKLPELLAAGDIRAVPATLVDIANNGGGHDNITAIAVRVSDDTQGKAAASDQASAKLDVLTRTQIFRYFTYKELVHVSNIAVIEDVAANHVIFEESSVGDAMYIVIAGTVRLTRGVTTVAITPVTDGNCNRAE